MQDGEVKIIDEYTGRLLEGRRYSEGLHQAIEAKEGVKIKEENQTLATITLQNYFRLYEKMAGMTGTAATEADEFRHTYGQEVVVIPTNVEMIRDDRDDLIYKTEAAKFRAVVEDIADCYQRQPAGAGGHHLRGEVRASLGHAGAAWHPAQRPERQAPRQRSRHRRGGGAAGRHHHRHQHGRTWDRHQAGRGCHRVRGALRARAPRGTSRGA